MSHILAKKSVFGTGAVFRGKISKVGAVDIHGEVYADFDLDKLVLEKTGSLEGNVRVGLGVMAGRFAGKIHAHSIWLMKSSILMGEIEYASLQMDRGAALNCRIKHNWETPPPSVSAAKDENPADMMPPELVPQKATKKDGNKS
ncbi:polymer-forming cytoskeletal protein [Alphaproteobacteria bacterium]|nr:polymer-forming cytoskeletal protein [Alphaproteobacteria bacterium]